MNSKQRYRAQRSAEHHAKKRAEMLARQLELAEANGCSGRVTNALTGPSLRQKHSGPICLPDVAIYQAGYRKSDVITAR